MRHSYFSTACHHAQHESCPKRCTYCLESCRCNCHGEILYDSTTWIAKTFFPRLVHQIGFNNQGEPAFEIRCKCGWNYIVARRSSTHREISSYLRARLKDHRKYGCGRVDYNDPAM